MTFIAERLVELRRHLDHLSELRPRVEDADQLRRDLSLHNDVLFSLLTVAQLVIDLAGELSAREGMRFEDYTGAVRNLAHLDLVSADDLEELERLPGFRNILLHEYVAFDLDRAVDALDRLDPVERLLERIRRRELEA